MEGWQVAVVVLLSVFVAMWFLFVLIWIPASLQLWATLRSAQRFFDHVGSRAGATLAELSETVVALNKAVGGMGELAHSASQLKDSIRLVSSIGAAVGPAIVAAVRALRAPEEEEPAGDGHEMMTQTGAPAETAARMEATHGREDNHG